MELQLELKEIKTYVPMQVLLVLTKCQPGAGDDRLTPEDYLMAAGRIMFMWIVIRDSHLSRAWKEKSIQALEAFRNAAARFNFDNPPADAAIKIPSHCIEKVKGMVRAFEKAATDVPSHKLAVMFGENSDLVYGKSLTVNLETGDATKQVAKKAAVNRIMGKPAKHTQASLTTLAVMSAFGPKF